MKFLVLIFVSIAFFSCKKTAEPAIRLLRTESTSYTGTILHTEYGYDNSGRITSITQYENNAPPVVVVTITYSSNEAKLLSHPDFDPAYDQTTEVKLTLDANGRTLKRIEYTHGIGKTPPVQPTETFKYDTLVYEYDGTGLLKKTTRSRYDSTWANSTYNTARRITSTASYTNNAGNLTSSDEYAVYPAITRNGGVTTISGGSSEYHNVFSYTKSFPNQTDFTNTAVLNEYQFYYEPPLNVNYKNMPDQVTTKNTDKDINGSVIFTGNSTIDSERTYNNEGLLSSVNVAPGHTQYIAVKYFYGR